MQILIVESRYHAHVADRLLDGATAALEQGGASFTRASVPGVLELPGAIALAARGPRPFDGCVALGCVIGRGAVAETLYRETLHGLVSLSVSGVPLGNGVLFAPDEAAALELAETGDAGGDAARAALSLTGFRDRLALL